MLGWSGGSKAIWDPAGASQLGHITELSSRMMKQCHEIAQAGVYCTEQVLKNRGIDKRASSEIKDSQGAKPKHRGLLGSA